jgi:alpha-glucosidase
MLLFTLPGTLTMYYGEEIGMTNVQIPPDQVQDPAEKNEPGIGQGRDPERTPMCWDRDPLAGFTTGMPWLPLGKDHPEVNVAVQQGDDASILHLYRGLIALRKSHPTLISGKLHAIRVEQSLLRFRRSGTEEIEVMLNMTHEPITAPAQQALVLAATHRDREGRTISGLLTLRPAEGLVLLLA